MSATKTETKTITMHFIECEHEGDLDMYTDDIHECGGKVKNYDLNYEAETADVTVEIDNPEEFKAKFSETDTADFAGHWDYYL